MVTDGSVGVWTRRRRSAGGLLALVLALGVLLPAGNALGVPSTGVRVRVALFGDSVTESIVDPTFLTTGLAPALAKATDPLGPFTAGAVGLIPATPYRWHVNDWSLIGYGPAPQNGWVSVGTGETIGMDGPSGFSMVTASQQATATTTVTEPNVQILYTSSQSHCLFAVTTPGHQWLIDTYRAGPLADVGTSIVVPSGPQQLTVHGSNCEFLDFLGAVVERPLQPGQTQLEVDNLGHSGKLPWVDLQPRVEGAIVFQQYDISVYLYAYIQELYATPALTSKYKNTMVTRIGLGRQGGGSCLVVAPTPLPASKKQLALTSQADAQVAKQEHCGYTTALTHLWPSSTVAMKKGLVVADGIHPTAAGYKLIANALAPVLAKMVRARANAA